MKQVLSITRTASFIQRHFLALLVTSFMALSAAGVCCEKEKREAEGGEKKAKKSKETQARKQTQQTKEAKARPAVNEPDKSASAKAASTSIPARPELSRDASFTLVYTTGVAGQLEGCG